MAGSTGPRKARHPIRAERSAFVVSVENAITVGCRGWSNDGCCFHFAGRSSGDAGRDAEARPGRPRRGRFSEAAGDTRTVGGRLIRIWDDFVPVVWPPRLPLGHRAPPLIDFVDRFTVGPGFLAAWRRDGRPFGSSVLKRARDAAVEPSTAPT